MRFCKSLSVSGHGFDKKWWKGCRAVWVGCSRRQPITPLTLGSSCLRRVLGISQKSLLCATSNSCCAFFPPSPLFCKGCASWEHFPCSALADARGHRDVPALVCSAPIPEGRGIEETSGTNKSSCNQNQLGFALGGNHHWGIPIVPEACPVQQNSQKGFVPILNSLFQEQRYLESPAVSCVLVCFCSHSDIPSLALITVFGELIKFPDTNCVFGLVCSWRGPSRAST